MATRTQCSQTFSVPMAHSKGDWDPVFREEGKDTSSNSYRNDMLPKREEVHDTKEVNSFKNYFFHKL